MCKDMSTQSAVGSTGGQRASGPRVGGGCHLCLSPVHNGRNIKPSVTGLAIRNMHPPKLERGGELGWLREG